MKNKITTILLISATIIVTILFLWPNVINTKAIQDGDEVSITYNVTLADWRIFSQWEEIIKIWEWTIPSIDKYLVWLHSWDKKDIVIPAEENYMQFYNPALVQRMPIYTLTQAGIAAQEQTFITLWSSRYYIQKIENDIATLDGNPEHTRQPLTYTITINAVQKKEE